MQVLETLSPGDCRCSKQVFMVFGVLGGESWTSPAEVSNCIPFWAASVCSCCKKANKLLEIPKISPLAPWGRAANNGDIRQQAVRALEASVRLDFSSPV